MPSIHVHAAIRGCEYAGLLDEVLLCSISLNAFVCSYRLFCFPRICGVRAGLALVNTESVSIMSSLSFLSASGLISRSS
jgi:hypothetical protein